LKGGFLAPDLGSDEVLVFIHSGASLFSSTLVRACFHPLWCELVFIHSGASSAVHLALFSNDHCSHSIAFFVPVDEREDPVNRP
jgi:hypothetical protein